MSEAMEMELKELRRQVALLQAELVTMRHPKARDDRLMLATRELDAIVETTATATDNILAAAEEIGSTIDTLQRKSEDPAVEEAADRLGDLISRLYTECSFQDLTGQRITKVVNTLRYLEQRVNAMIEIWGIESGKAVDEQADKRPDAHLLNGPARPGQEKSQTEIDAILSGVTGGSDSGAKLPELLNGKAAASQSDIDRMFG
jgi:chemotaxis regulatin CheY-phosphate phosphatase CheZ